MTTVIPIDSWNDGTFTLSFALFHNSLAATKNATTNSWPGLISPGRGWSTSFSGSVYEWSEGSGKNEVFYATVIEDDGTRNNFQFDKGDYIPPTGVHDRLRYDNVNNEWTLTRPDQSKRIYNDNGILIRTENPEGYSITITRGTNYLFVEKNDYPFNEAFYVTLHPSGKPISLDVNTGNGNSYRRYYFGYGDREWPAWENEILDCDEDRHCGYSTGGITEDCTDRTLISSSSWFNWFVYPSRTTVSSPPPCLGLQNTISFRYNSNGTIAEIIERDGSKWSYDYIGTTAAVESVAHHPFSGYTGSQAITHEFGYCVPSLITSCVEPLITTPTPASWSYYTDPRGNLWMSGFDSDSRLMFTVDPENNLHEFGYDSANNLTSYEDPLGHTTTMTYGPVGNLLTTTSHLSQVTTIDWETPSGEPGDSNFRRPILITDPAGWETEFEYSDTAYPTKVTKIIEQADGEGNGAAETIFTYTPDAPYGSPNFMFNPGGLIASVTDANGVCTTWTYTKDNSNNFATTVNEGADCGSPSLRGVDLTPVNWGNAVNYGGDLTSGTTDNVLISGGTQQDGQGSVAGCLVPDIYLRGEKPVTHAPPRLVEKGAIPSPDIASIRSCTANSTLDPYDLRDPVGRPLMSEHCLPDESSRVFTWAYNDPFKRSTGSTITSNEPGFELERSFTSPWVDGTDLNYDAMGLPLRVQGPDGEVYLFEYDSLGRMIESRRHVPMRGGSELLAEYFYDAASRLIAVVGGNGVNTFYTYDAVNRLTDVEWTKSTLNGGTLLGSVEYTWSVNNLVTQRVEYNGTTTATTDFTYDLRGRLIREERDSTGSDDYDFSYTYDQLGNRLTKLDNLSFPAKRVRYLYDLDPQNSPEGFETRHNRLMKYIEETEVEEEWVETREVAYTYYRTGHASNITIKDALDPIYRDLALYYDASGRLGYALWDEWELDSKTGLPDMLTYERTRALEFRYDPDGRQRYMARELDPDELPDIVPLESPKGRWVEYAGVSPYADGEYEHGDDESFELTRRYEPGAEIDLLEEETLWQHGDLIGSTIAETNDGESTANVQAYTAFGERVGAGAVNSRYRYGGGWGYESGLLVLEGAAATEPIEFLHLGERWYQPNVGRFIQRDPIGIEGGMNVYEYLESNPVDSTDSRGLFADYKWDRFYERRDQMSPEERKDFDRFNFVVGTTTFAVVCIAAMPSLYAAASADMAFYTNMANAAGWEWRISKNLRIGYHYVKKFDRKIFHWHRRPGIGRHRPWE